MDLLLGSMWLSGFSCTENPVQRLTLVSVDFVTLLCAVSP